MALPRSATERKSLVGSYHSSFAQWIRLEADPAVITFCERPVRIGPQRDARLVDFWVGALNGEAMLLLESGRFESVPAQLDDIAIRTIGPAELAAASVWISNWSCMLPVINTTRNLVPRSLLRTVLDHVCEPLSRAHVRAIAHRQDACNRVPAPTAGTDAAQNHDLPCSSGTQAAPCRGTVPVESAGGGGLPGSSERHQFSQAHAAD